jgi:hypothetical protein
MRRALRDWSALLAAFVTGAALMSVVSATAQDPSPAAPDATNPGARERALAAEQVELAERILAKIAEGGGGYGSARSRIVALPSWSRRLVESRLTLARTTEDRVAAIQPHIDRLEALLEAVEPGVNRKFLDPVDQDMLRFELLDAQRWLIREKGL